jgi:hypothetical protein
MPKIRLLEQWYLDPDGMELRLISALPKRIRRSPASCRSFYRYSETPWTGRRSLTVATSSEDDVTEVGIARRLRDNSNVFGWIDVQEKDAYSLSSGLA